MNRMEGIQEDSREGGTALELDDTRKESCLDSQFSQSLKMVVPTKKAKELLGREPGKENGLASSS